MAETEACINLPIFQDENQNLMLMQTSWKSELQKATKSPILSGIILPNVSLINGTTQVNHRLGRKLLGWWIVRLRASASIYDSQDSNQKPELTLSLVSNAAVVVDLFVF